MNDIDILIFKTDIRYKTDLKKLSPFMSGETRIKKWNVDRSDIDRVLRIESSAMSPEEVINLIERAGYSCEELTD